MSIFKKFFKSSEKSPYEVKKPAVNIDNELEQRRRDDLERDGTGKDGDDEARRMDGTEVVYFAFGTPQDRLVELLKSLIKDVQVRAVLAYHSHHCCLSLSL